MNELTVGFGTIYGYIEKIILAISCTCVIACSSEDRTQGNSPENELETEYNPYSAEQFVDSLTHIFSGYQISDLKGVNINSDQFTDTVLLLENGMCTGLRRGDCKLLLAFLSQSPNGDLELIYLDSTLFNSEQITNSGFDYRLIKKNEKLSIYIETGLMAERDITLFLKMNSTGIYVDSARVSSNTTPHYYFESSHDLDPDIQLKDFKIDDVWEALLEINDSLAIRHEGQ